MASFLPWQRVVAAAGGLLYGDTEIDEDVMPYFEERKLDKIATFRQLQGPIKFNQTYSVLGRGVDLPESFCINPGYENMIYNVTGGKVSLDHFSVPESCCIRRLEFGEIRVTDQVDDVTLHFIQKPDGDRVCILPKYVRNIFTLILCLDEGSIGMAGVGAAAFYLKKMVWVKPDKIHRVIRDLKLAEGHCCGKSFEKAKLW